MSEHETRPDDVRADEREELEDYDYVPGGKRRKGRGLKGCLAVLVALVVLVGGFYVALTQGVDVGRRPVPGPPRTTRARARARSSFDRQRGRHRPPRSAATSRPRASSTSVAGLHRRRRRRARRGRHPGRRLRAPEGDEGRRRARGPRRPRQPHRVPDRHRSPRACGSTEIVSTLAENTDFPEQAVEPGAAAARPPRPARLRRGQRRGLPVPGHLRDQAGHEAGRDILKMMVDRWREAADDAGLEEKAAELGKTPGELMIIASLIEAEGRGDDMPKISRVIYNRLDGPGDKGGTNGTAQHRRLDQLRSRPGARVDRADHRAAGGGHAVQHRTQRRSPADPDRVAG